MKIAVSGASGFIGTPVTKALRAEGHEVIRLVRRAARGPDEVRWDPQTGTVDLEALAGTEGIINLAGMVPGARPLTDSVKRTLYQVNVGPASATATAALKLSPPPRVLIGQGAMGYYGQDRGDTLIDESFPPGDNFLARVVRDKEAALDPAEAAGIRVVKTRTGLVMDKSGQTLGRRLLPLFRLGLGGRLGSGRQWWSIVSLDDTVRALLFLLSNDTASGPYNVTAPEPTTNAEFTKLLAAAVHRPAWFFAPPFALRFILGEFADDILGSLRGVPTRLLDAGFRFAQPDAPSIVRAALD
jgi:uncharacterized protein